ncbi:helix-turn-helix domain-containing protein [Streptomyces xiaopingdaonensis]|uniref:helix-turn-helix domain-containing protein n=1 Tax=Streptomyces xiaopingdaonensis TaxID=1565415 RepID=UPI0002EB2288
MSTSKHRTAREKYGDELRRRRKAAGMTQEELAALIVCSPTLISHFEAGRRLPNPEDAARIDKALGTDGWFARWLEDLEHRFADHFAEAAELEQQATEIREFGTTLVPGLIQTPEYARAVFRAAAPNPEPTEIDEYVVNRMARSALLSNPKVPQIWVVLDEAALQRPVGGSAAMAEQLAYVAELCEKGRIRLHIVPFACGAYSLMEGDLKLMNFSDAAPVAYVEGVMTGRLVDDPASVAQCNSFYTLALGEALPERASWHW